MTILLSGGGSGGHITPILAIAEEIKKQKPNTKIVYIGQTGDDLGLATTSSKSIDQVFTVRAGKYRRYHGSNIWQKLDIKTFILNCRDIIYLLIGIWQSKKIIKKIKPDILFTRGGYVSVPVGIGAKLNNVSFITHDSDITPSLANKIIAKWAIKNFVSMEENLYPYPLAKTINTGIPISKKFHSVNVVEKNKLKKELQIPQNSYLLLVTGGGLGSQIINLAVIKISQKLLSKNKNIYIVHIAGIQNESQVKKAYNERLDEELKEKIKVFGYIDNLYEYSGAADVIIARAGATNIAEFAIQQKACILVPSSFLVGGHQLQNANYLSKRHAALVIDENIMSSNPDYLYDQIAELISNKENRLNLIKNISKLARPDSTEIISKMIINLGSENEIKT